MVLFFFVLALNCAAEASDNQRVLLQTVWQWSLYTIAISVFTIIFMVVARNRFLKSRLDDLNKELTMERHHRQNAEQELQESNARFHLVMEQETAAVKRQLAEDWESRQKVMELSHKALEQRVHEKTRDLEESERRYRALVEKSHDAIFIHADNNFLFINDKAMELTGYSKSELYCMDIDSLIHPEDKSFIHKSNHQPQHDQRMPEIYEARFKTKSGKVKVGDFASTLTYYKGKRAVMVTVRDITDRKITQRELQEANKRLEEALVNLQQKERQLVQQERLRAVGQMASGVAHDFNNALQPILMAANIVATNEHVHHDTELLHRYIQRIETAARDAANTVKRLVRFYSAHQQSDIIQINLCDLVREVVDLTQPKWREEAQSKGCFIEVQTELQGTCLVDGYHDELREMLTNLLFNAVESIRPGKGQIVVRCKANQDKISMEISDTGKGMSEEIRRKCLEPFFTTRVNKGSGLGLSIAYGIIERHHGEIAISSEEDQGTTVQIVFPQASWEMKQIPSADEQPILTEKVDNKAYTILFIDDEESLSNLMYEALSFNGHRVIALDSGIDAWEAFQNNLFDIVITDQSMPGMTGIQLGGKIKNKSPRTPVILLTGFGDTIDIQEKDARNIDLILSKPISPNNLEKHIREVMSKDFSPRSWALDQEITNNPSYRWKETHTRKSYQRPNQT